MKRINKEIVEACSHCPKHAGRWSDESICTELEPQQWFKGIYLEGFPEWCPLEDYKEEK
jgi:hypothetical protein